MSRFVYRRRIETSFSASHTPLRPDGSPEPVHGHDWRVRLTVTAAELGPAGMLIDDERLQSTLNEVAGQFDHQHLNELPVFAERNPVRELVAEAIVKGVAAQLSKAAPGLFPAVALAVEVWETPTETAACELLPDRR
jgi:6-pyruvoyltetrahydropterin/6-carboxytetrahydropterin synthase